MNNIKSQVNFSEGGFSILEALVAIAILAVAFLPLLDMQMQFTRTINTIERNQNKDEINQAVLTRLSSMNFSQFPDGTEQYSNYSFTWHGEPLEMDHITTNHTDRFETKLYQVTISFSHNTQSPSTTVRLVGIGWEARRSITSSLF